MERILVLRGGALGDFIVTLPALARLRERWPGARIELAGNAVAGQLAVARGVINAVHSQHEARWATLYGDAPLAAEFVAWLTGFDLIISYWPDPDGDLDRRLPLHRAQRYLSAPAMPARGPAAAHYGEPLRELGIESHEHFFRLTPLPDAALRVTQGRSRRCYRGPRRRTLLPSIPGAARHAKTGRQRTGFD